MEAKKHRLTRGVKRWFILTGVFFVSFFETGTVRSFGVILNDMTSDFQSSTAYIGTIIGMAHGATYWLSVLNTPLLKRFSVRQVVMTGGFIGSVGLICSAFAESKSLFAASLFVFGIGFSTVVLPANSSPVDYFPDLFEIASSINLTGGGIGLMLLPLLFEVFVTSYGWRGALMLLGAINLNTLVSGVLLEPIPRTVEGGDVDLEDEEDAEAGRMMLKEHSGTRDHFHLTTSTGEHSLPTASSGAALLSSAEDYDEDEKDICEEDAQRGDVRCDLDIIVESDSEDHLTFETHHVANGGIVRSANTNTNCKADSANHIEDTDEKLSSRYGNHVSDIQSASNGNDHHSNGHHDMIASYDIASNTCTVKERMAEEDRESEDYSDRNCFVRGFHSVAKLFDLYLFIDYPVFFGICLATILFGVSYDGWVLFVIPNAEAKGFGSQMAVYIATAGGVGNIFGRFCIGFFTAKKCLRNEVTYLLLNLMSAVAFFVNFGATGFWFLSVLSFVNGFSLGAKTSLQFIIVNGTVATERYKAAVSMLLVSLGIGFPISGALLGGIYDKTSSYNISFCVIGFIDVICGFLISAPLITACCRRWSQRNHVEIPTDDIL